MVRKFLLKDVTSGRYYEGIDRTAWSHSFTEKVEDAKLFNTYEKVEQTVRDIFLDGYSDDWNRMLAVEGVFVRGE